MDARKLMSMRVFAYALIQLLYSPPPQPSEDISFAKMLGIGTFVTMIAGALGSNSKEYVNNALVKVCISLSPGESES